MKKQISGVVVICVLVSMVADLRAAASGGLRQELSGILEVGVPHIGSLAGNDSHSYRMPLAAGQYFSFRLEQLGIDVVIRILGPDGKLIEEFNSLDDDRGPEAGSLIASATGEYKIEVRAHDSQAGPGQYDLRLQEIRLADAADKARIAARRDSKELTSSLEAAMDARDEESLLKAFEKAVKELKAPSTAPLRLREVIETAIDFPLNGGGSGTVVDAARLSERLLRLTESAFGPGGVLVARNLIISGDRTGCGGLRQSNKRCDASSSDRRSSYRSCRDFIVVFV